MRFCWGCEMLIRRFALLSVVLLSMVLLGGCSGGGGSSSSSTPPAASPPTEVTGVFVDSPVSGLAYSTPTGSGLTNEAGEFQYLPGETVTFRLGNLTLGSASGATTVSPIDLVGATSIDNARQLGRTTRLTNLLLLLQSLDLDGDPENGIDLTGLDSQISALNMDLDFDSENFSQGNYRRLVNVLGGRYVAPRQALNHLLSSLNENVTVSVLSTQRTELFGSVEVTYNTTFTADSAGKITGISRDDGRGASITYDAAGRLANISETFPNTDVTFLETFTYDASGNTLSRSLSINDEVRTQTTFVYDDTGNVIEERSTTFGFGSVFVGLYYVELLLLPEILGIALPLATPDISSPLISPVAANNEQTIETVRLFEYNDEGVLLTITQQGPFNSVIQLNEERNCYEIEIQASFVAAGVSSFQPFSASALSLGTSFCDSGQTIELDDLGRIAEIRIEATNASSVTRFRYEGSLLILQETLSDGEQVAATTYSYDSFGELTQISDSLSGFERRRVSREYQRRVLTALP